MRHQKRHTPTQPTPAISIIVPTFNEERAIETTLQGIRRLSGLSYELIVSDSGSTDGTVEIAREYADNVVAYDDYPKNAARGRNLGARAAHGAFLVFIDADVTVVAIRDFFDNALEAFVDDPTLVAITMRIEVASGMRTNADSISYELANAATLVANNVLHLGLGSGELQMIRADAFKQAGGYNERLDLSEDVELYTRLAKLGKVRMLPELLVEHPGRRPHAIGWPKLWRLWVVNTIYVRLTGEPWDTRWPPIR